MIRSRFIGDRAFYRRVFRVMTPILIQNVITNFVNLLDNIMVGRVGTEPMSGVAIVNQLVFVFNLFVFGAVAGAGIFTAQYYGKNDDEGVRWSLRAKLCLVFFVCALSVAVFLLRGEALISLFLHRGAEDLDLAATLGYGKDYLRVMLWGLLPFALVQVYSGTLRETGETVVPMTAGIVAVFVNLVFNYALIYGKLGAPKLGVTGAAAATVIARCTECLVVTIWSHTHPSRVPWLRGAYRSFRIPLHLVRRIAVVGTPVILNEVMWAAGTTTLNPCYSVRGLEVVSALNISNTVSNLFFCAFFSMGATVAIIVGQLLGAGELERAVDEDRKLIALSVTICTLTGAVMASLVRFFPEIYNTTPGVKALASRFLLVSSAMMPFHSYCNACYFTLRAGGKTAFTFVFDSVYIWTLSVPLAFVLTRFTRIPILPIFLALEGLEMVKCVLGWYLVKKRIWVKNLVGTPRQDA